MANGNPILVTCDESDVWMVYLSVAHLVGPIVYLDPPLAAVRSAQLPLITSVHTFCRCRLKTAAHGIEHILWRRFSAFSKGERHTGGQGHSDEEDAFAGEAHC